MLAAETLPYSSLDPGGALADEPEHGAQILEIQQQQPLVVGDAERNVENAFLGVVEIE